MMSNWFEETFLLACLGNVPFYHFDQQDRVIVNQGYFHHPHHRHHHHDHNHQDAIAVNQQGITFSSLKSQLSKHDGLLENLTIRFFLSKNIIILIFPFISCRLFQHRPVVGSAKAAKNCQSVSGLATAIIFAPTNVSLSARVAS